MGKEITKDDFEIAFAESDMQAFVTVKRAEAEFTKEQFLDILGQFGVRYGIKEEQVVEIAGGSLRLRPILIAEGMPAKVGEPGQYEYFFRTQVDKIPRILKDGSVDYQNIEWFEVVQAGQKLAQYHPASEGVDGCTVKGVPVKARKGIEMRPLTGKGFRFEADKRCYYATQNGMIQLDGNELQVINHLELDEVTLATGNVVFNGSVHVRGNVGYGTVIKAMEDVVVDGTVEGATIESGGNVILKKGMNAAGHGSITAKNDVISRFLESVTVHAKGNIEVDKSLNSFLYASGMIKSSKVLSGGVAQAEKGFHVNNVGNHVGIQTLLRILVDEEVWLEYKKLRIRMMELQNEVPVNVEELADVTYRAQTIEHRIQRLRNSNAVILGHAYAGTTVEMTGCKWAADDQYNVTVAMGPGAIEVVNNY